MFQTKYNVESVALSLSDTKDNTLNPKNIKQMIEFSLLI
jgi:hypothetical protein